MSQLFNENAAGIDISSRDHYVAVPSDRAKENVRCSGAFTMDLHQIGYNGSCCATNSGHVVPVTPVMMCQNKKGIIYWPTPIQDVPL